MSQFEDAINQALSTPPMKTKKLLLNERTELKGVAGRVLDFKTLKIDSKTEKPREFILEIEIVPPENFQQPMIKWPVQPREDRFSRDSSIGPFYPEGGNMKMPINQNAKVYLTFKPGVNKTDTQVKHCIFTYALETHY